MSALLYRGFNTLGRRFCGSKNLASESLMKDYLDKRGITDYEIFESKTVCKSGMYALISPKELSILCKQMSVIFHSQITLMEGVLVLSEQTDNKQLGLALEEIYGFMEKGHTFAESIGMYDHLFPPYLLSMIFIGETSGTLEDAFSRMSVYFDKESKIRKKIKSAIMYPAVLTLLMTAIIVLLIVKILPVFGGILNSMGAQIPMATGLMISAASFLIVYAPFIFLLIAVIAIVLVRYVRTDKGRFQLDRLKLSLPAYGFINCRIIASRFSRSLSILLKSGAQLLNALDSVSILMDNRYLEEKLIAAVDKFKSGEELSGVLAETGVFPVLLLKMIVIGQKTGNLDEMLDKSASVFDDEAYEGIERLTEMLEPLLIIILSVIVGIILLSVILPMITIMNAIG